MSKPIHVLMRMKGQDTDFEGEVYPHYEIGWKKGNIFHVFITGLKKTEDEVEEWEEI